MKVVKIGITKNQIELLRQRNVCLVLKQNDFEEKDIVIFHNISDGIENEINGLWEIRRIERDIEGLSEKYCLVYFVKLESLQ